jgi:hypothetical protein
VSIADMAKQLACLEDNEVNVIGVVIDSAKNLLRRAARAQSARGVRHGERFRNLPDIRGEAAMAQLVRRAHGEPRADRFAKDHALRRGVGVAPIVHAVHPRSGPPHHLEGCGIDGRIPLVQDGKWNTEVQSYLFYRKNAAVIERVNLEQKRHAPRFYDHDNRVIDALVPMRTLIERTEPGEATLSEFFVKQSACKAEWKRMRGAWRRSHPSSRGCST